MSRTAPHKALTFELLKDSAGEYRFSIKGGNNKVIAVSEGYKTRASRDGAALKLMRSFGSNTKVTSNCEDPTLEAKWRKFVEAHAS